MGTLMNDDISRYYRTIISRIKAPEPEKIAPTNRQTLDNEFINGFGTIIYNVSQRGFFGIIDENGNKYFPFNDNQFDPLTCDRKQIQFSLFLHPEISNMYRWGKTVNLVSFRLLK